MRWRSVLVGVVVACLGAQWVARAAASSHKQRTTTYEHVNMLPPLGALQIAALGHQEALADLLWTRALIYLGDEAARNLQAGDTLAYAWSIVGLDPYFSAAYRTLAISANNRPGVKEADAIERLKKSIDLLEHGVRMLPNDGDLAWDTGAMYAYSLAPKLGDGEDYRAAKLRGLEHMQAATVRGAGPPWAGVANASTLIRLGQTQQAIAHLQELYAITSEPAVREGIEAQLAYLRSQAFMDGLRELSAELNKNHRRDFPYVSETLYLLLGKRPPFDRQAWLARSFDPVAETADSHETSEGASP